MNTAVSATVTGRVRICAMYAIGAYFQGGHRGGCSFMIHVRHAAAAIASGLCETVLITHGESGRSGVGRTCSVVAPTSLAGQFEQPYGPMGPPTLFAIPVLR
jgi:acetyl-CoA acetyltransferase